MDELAGELSAAFVVSVTDIHERFAIAEARVTADERALERVEFAIETNTVVAEDARADEPIAGKFGVLNDRFTSARDEFEQTTGVVANVGDGERVVRIRER